MNPTDKALDRLALMIKQGQYESVETEWLEIKPVPADHTQWKEIHKTVNAFLNTRGGVIVLGIKEEIQNRRYVFKGYENRIEPKIKEIPDKFRGRNGESLGDLGKYINSEIKMFLDGQVAVISVDELPADLKYCFLEKAAYQRVPTGDHQIKETEIEKYEEYKEEIRVARELECVVGTTPDDLDLDRLNEYISFLNRPTKVESLKADLASAISFLQRKAFIRDGLATTLGMLVCGQHPEDYLGFRCHVHCYVDTPNLIVQDKQSLCGNVLPLIEGSFSYVLRNIQVGISPAAGGTNQPEYPEELLRETINNALAHRDYSINRQVILSIKPGAHLSLSNPGTFRRGLLLDVPAHEIPLHRIIPEAKPRNPRLADVLRVYSKWEGRGIGMATLVNLCLDNRIDLPYYQLRQDEVSLFLCAGQLLDESMERLFNSLDAYLERKLNGRQPTQNQKLVLAYLIKSERANRLLRHTILLTTSNNHYVELDLLQRSGLISRHPESPEYYPVYVADRELLKEDYTDELREFLGAPFDACSDFSKAILGVVYRHNHFSKKPAISAKQVSFYLWAQEMGREDDIRGFDRFYRKVRYAVKNLLQAGFLTEAERSRYVLSDKCKHEFLC